MVTWKKIKVDKWRTLWHKGNFVAGQGYPDWVHVDKTSLVGEYEVGAKRKINTQTTNGHFKFYKGKGAKARAMKFAMAYRRKH